MLVHFKAVIQIDMTNIVHSDSSIKQPALDDIYFKQMIKTNDKFINQILTRSGIEDDPTFQRVLKGKDFD